MSIKDFLEENKKNNFSKHFSFNDFIDFYRKWGFSCDEITILKYSNNYYVVQFHKISKATIIISNDKKPISNEQNFFIESIISENNLIEPRKKDVTFINFFRNEINIRWKTFIFFVLVSFFLSIFVQSGLLWLSIKITEIFISILWVYFSIMIVFLTWSSFNYSEELYIDWKLSYYWNTDKNLAKLTFYTLLYLIIIFICIYLFWDKWFYIEWFRNIWFIWVWLGFYLTYLNFINLIDFYIDKISYLKMWEYKEKFFENNFNLKNK